MALGTGDIIRFAVESVGSNGVLYVNTFHYRLEGDAAFETNEPTVADTCSEFWNKINSAYRGCLYGDRTVRSVIGRTEVETWNGEVASAGEYVVGLQGTLAGGDGKLYRAQSMVVDLKSDVASRSARGWIMLPGSVNSTDADGAGNWSSTGGYYLAAVAFANLLDDNIQHDVAAVHAWRGAPRRDGRTTSRRRRGPW